MADVPVVFPGVSVVPVKQPSVVVTSVQAVTPKTVQVNGGSGSSLYSVYAPWLQIDGGNPFSVFNDADVMDGGKPSDW